MSDLLDDQRAEVAAAEEKFIPSPIIEIAKSLDIKESYLQVYGKYTAKVSHLLLRELEHKQDGKLILVTAINPTKYGEGKTTTAIGVAQGIAKLGKKVILCLREPSLGPVFGIKGGATGGGKSKLFPSDEINLHFTGDIHAITAANNLIAACIDNHIFSGNTLKIKSVTWTRVLDMNDRALRQVLISSDGLLENKPLKDSTLVLQPTTSEHVSKGVVRIESFKISVASELMAILCLSKDLQDLRARVDNIIIGYRDNDEPVYLAELGIGGSVCVLLKWAMDPNIVQTTEHIPAFVHGGPFANIAHGCNSLIATRLALKLADYVVTEAGFGADLGAEKFVNIKCRVGGIKPSAFLLVVTVRALKHHGNGILKEGIPHMQKHIENIVLFGVPVLVVLNVFPDDKEEELKYVESACANLSVLCARSEAYSKGGEGAIKVAQDVMKVIDSSHIDFKFLYDDTLPVREKIELICKKYYGAGKVRFELRALSDLEKIKALGKENLPVCMAKTQFSFSDDPHLLGRPEGFEVKIKRVSISNGAGFVVAYAGDIMTMPGLSKHPAAEQIDIDQRGEIIGL